jgi:hypothetical protein
VYPRLIAIAAGLTVIFAMLVALTAASTNCESGVCHAVSPAKAAMPKQPTPASAELTLTGGQTCGGFTGETRFGNLPVTWSYRLCELTEDSYEVQLRFRNLSRRTVDFRFLAWLVEPGSCEPTLAGSEPFVSGYRSLRPGQTEEWPYNSAVAHKQKYSGRVWSCVIRES